MATPFRFGANPAFVPSGSSPQAVSPLRASIRARATSLELNRLWALDAQWDEAAQQLRKAVHTGEFAGFDRAMHNFRKIHRETRAAQKAAGHKS